MTLTNAVDLSIALGAAGLLGFIMGAFIMGRLTRDAYRAACADASHQAAQRAVLQERLDAVKHYAYELARRDIGSQLLSLVNGAFQEPATASNEENRA